MKLTGKQIDAAYEVYLKAYASIAVGKHPGVGDTTDTAPPGVEQLYAAARAAKDYQAGDFGSLADFDEIIRLDLDAPAPVKTKVAVSSPAPTE